MYDLDIQRGMTQKQQKKGILLDTLCVHILWFLPTIASLALEWSWEDDSRRTEIVINDIIISITNKENE